MFRVPSNRSLMVGGGGGGGGSVFFLSEIRQFVVCFVLKSHI